MKPLEEFLIMLKQEAEKHCDLNSEISLDELPAAGGLYMEAGEGFADSKYYNKTEGKKIPVLILCRNASQARCLSQLESICNYFQKLTEYPRGEMSVWKNTEIAKYPSKIGRDEDGVYHYSCILNCSLYF